VTHETLDETIDRIAGEMTAVSADPAFADRVRPRLSDGHRPLFVPVLAPATIVSAVVIAIVLWPQNESPARADRELVAGSVAPMASLPATVFSALTRLPPRLQGGTFLAADSGAPAAPHGPAVADAQVESAGPDPLAIAELAIPPAVSPDAVSVAPLDVARLEVPELDTTYESKEPR
jgi:hypothetical protein